MQFNEKLRALRETIKLTQKELAEKSNVSEISIRKYEAGDRKPKLDIVKRLATALGVDPYDLMEMQPPEKGQSYTQAFANNNNGLSIIEPKKQDDLLRNLMNYNNTKRVRSLLALYGYDTNAIGENNISILNSKSDEIELRKEDIAELDDCIKFALLLKLEELRNKNK